jgi:probable F420-dependent oxidoreductase
MWEICDVQVPKLDINKFLRENQMEFGTHLFATEHSIQPAKFAKESEARGFKSVWFSEHTHIPTKFLNSGNGVRKLPDYYWQTYDPFIASTLAAAATETIKIGTGVSLVLEHDVIALAKTVATVDQISFGRFIFGVGPGWLAEEMENHGVNYASRYKQINEQLKAMKVIWSAEDAEFHGKFVNFSRMKSFPKPIQSPYPPMIGGGGTGPKSLDLIVRHCDGWMPILGQTDWNVLKAGISKLHIAALDAKREPDDIALSIFCWSPPGEMTLEDMKLHGIEKIVISFEAQSDLEAMKLLDKYAKLIPD